MKSRVRKPSSYARKPASREPYATVLIVCEGEKTEPGYFRSLLRHYQLSSANIAVTPADGSDPLSIVAYAEARMEQYDRTYCVFDRDSFASFSAAVQKISQSRAGRNGNFIAATSIPCFELWLLLHFRYSAAPIVGAGGRSPGGVAEKELTCHIPAYKKGNKDTFAIIQPHHGTALSNARALRRHNVRTSSDNPDTRVHELIEYLRTLKK
jgi:hypothetical protein